MWVVSLVSEASCGHVVSQSRENDVTASLPFVMKSILHDILLVRYLCANIAPSGRAEEVIASGNKTH